MKKQFAWICVVDVAGILILVLPECFALTSFWH